MLGGLYLYHSFPDDTITQRGAHVATVRNNEIGVDIVYMTRNRPIRFTAMGHDAPNAVRDNIGAWPGVVIEAVEP
jgi:hypothetical protein